MKKYSKLIVAAIVALIFIGTFVFLYEKSQPKPVEYTEFTPKMADVLKTTVITGKIEPRNEVSVKPQISGIITEICKEAGDYVQAGEVIAKVKVIPDMGQLSSAQARVRLAEINLKQAQVDYGREEQLFKKQLVSADEFDKVKQAMKQAREEVTAAEDALQVVRDGVSKSNASASSTLIRSTISGIILDIPVKVGNSVILANTFNDGTTIASVANMNDLIFRGNIDETEVSHLLPLNKWSQEVRPERLNRDMPVHRPTSCDAIPDLPRNPSSPRHSPHTRRRYVPAPVLSPRVTYREMAPRRNG